eukprot:TRINITY_DN67134_c5_g1_i5.p1 TRINITY_DN67134_c5_g1~~TRINITY_DN67134_c5_g1_i5.p1  ORF type:complete len:277 (-),score=33.55 TRINITY_DN67134_c5_g1_i5:396-1178(-)
MPQNEHMELHKKRWGRRLDQATRDRKKAAREHKKLSKDAKTLRGLKAKIFHKTRAKEKAQLKKTIKEYEEKKAKAKPVEPDRKNAIPVFLEDRNVVDQGKILSNSIKQKRKDKAGKWAVPIPKVKPVSEEEAFRVMSSGNRRKNKWKRMLTKATFVPPTFTRKPPKYERFIRPMAMRFKKANVTHPELKTTFTLPIVGVKKNPSGRMLTNLGVMTKGTIIEVNVSELGLVTPGGKVVWAKYAQITNTPENDGCINAVLLV